MRREDSFGDAGTDTIKPDKGDVSLAALYVRKKSWSRLALGFLAFVVISVLAVAIRHVWIFRDSCVVLTIEESSHSASSVSSTYLGNAASAYVDVETESVEVLAKPNLLGVSLLVHRQSFSQGNLFSDALKYHKKGVLKVGLDYPTSAPYIDNEARVLRGDVVVRRVDATGTVRIRYGVHDIVLEPGDMWFELLIDTPEGIVQADESNWVEKFNEAYANGWPATRFVIWNMGLWPKARIREVATP